MKNNYDAVRLALAAIVLLSHIAALSALPELAWMERVFDSDFAVKGFFAISGCLVSRSYVSSRSWRDYAIKRFRRIYPAYLAVVVSCVVLGAGLGTLPARAFLGDVTTWKYLAANLSLMSFLQPTLPGLFVGNHVPAVNGALWTIKVEVSLYVLVPLIVAAHRRMGSMALATTSALLGAAWAWWFTHRFAHAGGAEIARQFPGQLPYFGLGAVIGLDQGSRQWLPRALLASAVAFALSWSAPWRPIVEPFFYATLVTWLATATPPLDAGRHGDLSYGLYLVHFPIVQSLVAAGLFGVSPVLGTAVAIFVAFGGAWVSWHLIEKRTLRRTARPESGTPRPSPSLPSA